MRHVIGSIGFTQARIIVIAVVLAVLLGAIGIHLYNDNRVRKDLVAANLLNTTREAKINALTNTRKDEIAAATKAAEVITKKAIDEKNAALTELGLEHINRLELTKRIEALNEAHNRKLADIKRNYDERMRLDVKAGINSSTTVREESERYKELSRSAPECDGIIADYETLKQACQLTTIDFNTCRLAYDADTVACGREK